MKLFIICLCFFCCGYTDSTSSNVNMQTEITDSTHLQNTLSLRFKCPEGFFRNLTDSASFAYFLRHLSLKPSGSLVKMYNGDFKSSENIYCAVVDMDISPKDLQQCADAVMRLRGEYLYSEKRYSEIAFRFLGDGKMHTYSEFVNGKISYPGFIKYMDHVFTYANTASLHKQLKSVGFYDMQIGDVLIQKGNPFGHAVIVVDICRDAANNKKYILAQSYMPAQETQILLNEEGNGPWYSAGQNKNIHTPEWTFDTTMLRRW